MNKHVKRCQVMFEKVEHFCGTLNNLTPGTTSLVEELGTTIGLIKELGRNQAMGRTTFGGGVDTRTTTVRKLRKVLRTLIIVTHQIAPESVDITNRFALKKGGGYQPLIDNARAFLDAMTPYREELVRRLSEEYVNQLTELVHTFDTGTVRKHSGVTDQVASTAGLIAAAERGIAIVRQLDPLIRARVGEDSGVLSTWKSVSRLERRQTETRNAPAATATASTGTPAPTPVSPVPVPPGTHAAAAVALAG